MINQESRTEQFWENQGGPSRSVLKPNNFENSRTGSWPFFRNSRTGILYQNGPGLAKTWTVPKIRLDRILVRAEAWSSTWNLVRISVRKKSVPGVFFRIGPWFGNFFEKSKIWTGPIFYDFGPDFKKMKTIRTGKVVKHAPDRQFFKSRTSSDGPNSDLTHGSLPSYGISCMFQVYVFWLFNRRQNVLKSTFE